MIEALKEFRPWLSGTVLPISIITNHKNLKYFMTSCQLNQRQACWSLELSEFNFKLSWAPGSKNPTDPPSQRPDYIPQEGDSIKNINIQMLLDPSHMEQLQNSAPSNPPPNPSSPFHIPFPTILNAATLLTINSSAPINKFKAALASDLSILAGGS